MSRYRLRATARFDAPEFVVDDLLETKSQGRFVEGDQQLTFRALGECMDAIFGRPIL